jgi:C1A family cysteine protease
MALIISNNFDYKQSEYNFLANFKGVPMFPFFSLITVSFLSLSAFADVNGDSSFYLDPPYTEQHRPKVELQLSENLSSSIALIDMVEAQSSVKSQGRRGTCSIFSATALLEFHLAKLGVADTGIDLSEQWLEYVTAGQSGMEGSWSTVNFNAYGEFGFVAENEWVYNPVSWTPYSQEYWDSQATQSEKEYFEKTCGSSRNTAFFEHCLIGQKNSELLYKQDAELLSEVSPYFDPEFAKIRTSAQMQIKDLNIYSTWMDSNTEILDILDQGEALTLDVDFFYEAWNHGKSESLGLGRNATAWDNGEVSYPHQQSKDYKVSRESANRAGHSVVIVGYDKDRIIEKTILDVNGNPLKVRSRGVYYFKNSWGKEGFGRNFKVNGKSFPGFGMISMEYAHEYGNFARMVVEKK